MVSLDELRDLFHYDSETGLITWRRKQGQVDRTGQEAGWIHAKGYRHLHIYGETYKAHRVAWALHYGEWPEGEIDHINHIRDDNRIANLRIVTRTQQMQNLSYHSTANTTGVRGIIEYPTGFRVEMQRGGVRYRKMFPTMEQAIEYANTIREGRAG